MDNMYVDRGWLSGVERVVSPNYNARPEGCVPELLVIHNISLPPNRFGGGYIEQFFQNRLDPDADPYFATISDLQVSAHLLIRRDGHTVQFVSFDERAWHAGQSSFCGRSNCNDFSVGIELEGADHIAYTEQQYQSLAQVSRALFNYYPHMSSELLAGHSDIAPDRKTDPGPAFNWQYFRSLINGDINA